MKLESFLDGIALCGLIYGFFIAVFIGLYPVIFSDSNWNWSISIPIVIISNSISFISLLYFLLKKGS